MKATSGIPTFNTQSSVFARQSNGIVLGLGRAGVSTFLTGHPPRREEGLPTFTLEKLVPGGITDVIP